MNIFLTLAFLFFIGATLGWVLELLFRRFFSSANPERKWINPGFCVGPYLPLYGCGLPRWSSSVLSATRSGIAWSCS